MANILSELPERLSRAGSGTSYIAFVCSGEYWTIGYDGAQFSLRDVKGLSYIQRLLQNPEEEFHALDLLSRQGTDAASVDSTTEIVAQLRNRADVTVRGLGDAGEMLDQEAKLQYRRRLHELGEKLEDLREKGAHDRAAEIESEIDFIQHEVARAVGLGGRNRRAGSTAERARLNVTRAIKSAIEKIALRDSTVAKLLDSSIRTGSFCSYVRDHNNQTNWRFSLALESERPVAAATAVFRRSESAIAQALAGCKAFVGREAESAALDRILEQTRNGSGRVVVISGPPGVGKTRIAAEFCVKAQRDGVIAFVGGCSDRDDPVPFLPFVEILEAALASASSPVAFREALGDEVSDVARLMPQLKRIFPDIPPPLEVAPGQSRRLLLSSITKVIERMAQRNPLILVLEDLHWADEGTLSLLEHIAQSISEMRVIVIGTYRDNELNPGGSLAHSLDGLIRQHLLERTNLRGLSETEVGEMIWALSGHQPPPALVALIHANTEGNPFFIEELFQHLVERGKLSPDGDFRANLNLDDIEVPDNVRLVIGRRLARLSDGAQRILRTAAVIGGSFTFEFLHAATGEDPDGLLGCIEESEGAGLITSTLQYPEARFRFAHELIRRTVIDGQSAPRRQRIHLSVAEAIERLYPQALEDYADDLAHHLSHAGTLADANRTIRFLYLAGKRAVERSANEKAISHLRRGLDLLKSLPDTLEHRQQELLLLTTLGPTLLGAKGFAAPDVEATYERARELCRQIGDAPQLFLVLRGLAAFYSVRAEYKTTYELGEQCLSVAQRSQDPILLLGAHMELGAALFSLGDNTQALDHLEQGLTTEKPDNINLHAFVHGQDFRVSSLSRMSTVLWTLGRPDSASTTSQEAIKLAHVTSHPHSLVYALVFDSLLHQLCGRTQATLEQAETAIALAMEHGFPLWAVAGNVLRGWALTERGLLEEGIAEMLRSMASWRSIGAEMARTYFLELLTDANLRAGNVEDALVRLDEMSSAVDKSGETFREAELHRLRGELLLKSRPSALQQRTNLEAERCFHLAISTARRQRAKSLELRAAMSLGRLLAGRGDEQQARELLGGVYQSFTEGFETRDLKQAKRLIQELS